MHPSAEILDRILNWNTGLKTEMQGSKLKYRAQDWFRIPALHMHPNADDEDMIRPDLHPSHACFYFRPKAPVPSSLKHAACRRAPLAAPVAWLTACWENPGSKLIVAAARSACGCSSTPQLGAPVAAPQLGAPVAAPSPALKDFGAGY